jgi:hypothetical protein
MMFVKSMSKAAGIIIVNHVTMANSSHEKRKTFLSLGMVELGLKVSEVIAHCFTGMEN